MFTKGPWTVNLNNQKKVLEVWPDKPGLGRICTVMNRDPRDERANANLIAAAPDLLEACELLQAALTEYHLRDVKKRFSLGVADAAASKAVAKAQGRC